MGRLHEHSEKATDSYSVGSKKKLKKSVEHKMKRIYVQILDVLEKEKLNGNVDDETFGILRSQILNIGNSEIRNIRKELDDRYNVEFVTYHVKFDVRPLEGYPDIVMEGRSIYEG